MSAFVTVKQSHVLAETLVAILARLSHHMSYWLPS